MCPIIADLTSFQHSYLISHAHRAKAMRNQQAGATALTGLGRLWLSQGKDEQAEEVLQRALSIWEQQLGLDHLETAQTLHDLALLRQQQGRVDEAISLAERAHAIRSASLGEAHLKTIATQTFYNQLIQAQARAKEEETTSQQELDQPSTPARSIEVRGATGQVAYTRSVRMRDVTFTCTVCGQTVTQRHYPSGRIKYCSEACRAIRGAQLNEKRVAKQREKRRSERGVQRQAWQGKDV